MSKSRTEILQELATKHYDLPPFLHPIIPKHTFVNFDIPPLSLTTAMARLQTELLCNAIPPLVCQATLARSSQLANMYQESFAKACRELIASSHTQIDATVVETIQSLRDTMVHIYENKDIPQFLSVALRARTIIGEKTSGRNAERGHRERKPFNHEFTPLLEKYFQQNAFPSAADRKSLAANGNMSPRQIEVWFQNHRNRAKKEGQTVKRLPPGAAVNVSLDLFTASTSSAIGSPTDDDADDNSLDEESEEQRTTPQWSILDHTTAAPTDMISATYTPLSIEPFTGDCGEFGLPPPSWTRSSTKSQSRPSINMDELVEQFSRLNCRDAAPRKSLRRTPTPRAPLRSCFSATITFTCPRSHPAFVRQKSPVSATITSPKSTILPQIFVPTSIPSLPSSLPSWDFDTQSTPERRKPTSLPRRSPSSMPSRTSQSPYPQQSLSRMTSSSSLSSITSSDSRSSSTSSASSSTSSSASTESSPELRTPPLSPETNVAHLAADEDDLFGDNDPQYIHSYSQNQYTYEDQPFDRNVSMSIPQFEALCLPTFPFFNS